VRWLQTPGRRREAEVEAEVRRQCERDPDTLWVDARWLEVLGRERLQGIVADYGYGPMRSSFDPGGFRG
jgi:hypothetical protein